MTAASFDRKAIVLGGTGFLGTRVVRELRSHGFTACIATRFPEKAAHSNDNWENETRLVRIDLSDPGTLELAFKGASAVINCIGFYIESRTESFRDVHVAGARKIAEAAMSRGVQNLIHISGIAAKRDSPSAYVRARADGKEDVRRAFPAATVLRPSVMFSRGGAFFWRTQCYCQAIAGRSAFWQRKHPAATCPCRRCSQGSVPCACPS
jgi:uncharacterized protein YbjT (DUF2867 family)